MKIVWIVPGFSSDEKDWCIPALLHLARAVANRCDLHIIALRYPYRRDTYTIGSATVHALGGGHRGPHSTPGIWLQAWQMINKLNGDILHAFWAWEPGIIAALSGRNRPCIVSVAGGELIHLPEIGYGLWGRAHVRLMVKRAFNRAQIVTVGSRPLFRIATPLVKTGRLRLAPLGVEFTAWSRPDKPTAEPALLNVASLEPVKGQRILLDAFRHVLNSVPGACLRIAGNGRLLDVLGEQARHLSIEKRLEFCGPVLHDLLPALHGISCLFVQSSLYESQGMAVLEAGASGLAVVGSEVGALADLAPDASLPVKPGDAEPLAEAIIALLRDRDWAARLSANALDRIKSEYSLEAATDRFIRLYEEVL